MRVGINLTDLIPGKVGGMENYMRSLLYYLPLVSSGDQFFAVGYRDILKGVDLNGCNEIAIKRVQQRDKQSELLKKLIIKNRFDVWFSPLLILDPLDCPVPSAFTIPDMQHEYFPNFFDQETLSWRKINYQQSVTRADLVFTLSKNSRNDIIRFLDVDPRKVKAIYLDSPEWFREEIPPRKAELIKKKYHLPDKYLFYPSNTWPHKNHLRLMEAFNRIKDEVSEVSLLFSGYPHQATGEIQKYIKKYRLADRIKFLGYVKTKDLPGIYKNALGLIFPSLFEGFGIPIVEALRSRCPVLCANNTSIPEVAGNAALYFDAPSVSSIANAIVEFSNNEELRKRLTEQGYKQAEKFSYKQTAAETLKYLREIVKKPEKEMFAKQNIYWPKISVITPSFNQGKYVERTIKSVLEQHYPNLEYIVVDGGSTDTTVKILKKYSGQLQWISEKDDGQADAINKGIKMSTGEILAYLNSDDTYEKNTLKTIALFFKKHPRDKFVYGKGRHIDQNDNYIEDYPNQPTDYKGLHSTCHICQPAAFWKRDLIDKIGYFDPSLKYAMDYDYWIRISRKYRLNYIDKYLGNTRFYPETKTLGQRARVHREIIEVQKRYYDKVHTNWIFAFVHAKLGNNPRKTALQNTLFIITLIMGSFYGYLKFNHQIPPRNVWRYYLIWLKEMFAFIIKRRYTSLF